MTLVKSSTDAWVDKLHTAANHGQAAYLYMNGDATNTRYAFVFFARPFPLGATIHSATLNVYLGAAWAGSQTLTAKRVTDPWTELGITWANQPAVTTANSGAVTVASGALKDVAQIDLTAMMGVVSAGSPWYGLRLEISSSGNKSLFAAENPQQTYRAALDVDWSTLPLGPVNLMPRGGLSVSLTKPVLDWQFASKDHTALRKQAMSQVQVNTTTDFTSPSYNSGMVANTESNWDLNLASSPSFSALADGDVRYWRVRVQDDTGQNSDWSDIVQFKRTTQGTLTISNPPAPASNQVSEVTPPITYALAGRTQQAVEIFLFQYDGTRKILKWHYPKTVTTATSVDVPTNIIRSTETFNVNVRTWDTIARATTQGDPDYVSLGRDFTYVRAGGITAVTNLTATPVGAAVNLTWQRASDPILFCLRVDGEEIMNDIDPAVVFTSGTSYAMNYYGASPRVSHTYEIEAIAVSGGKLVHSTANDTKTATTTPVGHYLIDPDDGKSVHILGLDAPDMSIRESGTTYDISGSRIPVRITDAVGGYSGAITGFVSGKTNRDDLLTLKGRLKPLTLVVGDANISVVLEEVATSPDTTRLIDDAYNVTVNYFQIDGADTFAVAGG